jgi:hypothetical protein
LAERSGELEDQQWKLRVGEEGRRTVEREGEILEVWDNLLGCL